MMFDMVNSAEFWVAAAFVILVALLFKPLRQRIVSSLDQRAEEIRREMDEAAHLVEEAQNLFADYQKKRREVGRECEAILARAGEKAERLRLQSEEALTQSLEARQRQATARIAQAEAEAIETIRNRAADITARAAHTLLTEELKSKDQAALITTAVKDISRRFH